MKQMFTLSIRAAGLAFLTLFVLSPAYAPALAQDAEQDSGIVAPQDETTWQTVITQQIDAFRDGDAEGAYQLSSIMFKQRYRDPERFMSDVLSWGYEPLLHSTSHSFGAYRPVGNDRVLQIVQVIGSDQGYYQALYQLGYEEDGWKIQGVQMSDKQGVGI